ncbi:MAG TPA: PLP-dependent aminotransferase family protein [Ignavibacteriaceae bacterium]|nr:PLP-dependent aminotransferase family protein [Ignavibacteriaceae bacterium]
MSRQIEEIPLIAFKLDPSSHIPLYKQLYIKTRNAILEGKFIKGQKLPGTRSLASELKISRNTVALAFAQLFIEGYITGQIGSGTYISEIPDNFFDPAKRPIRINTAGKKNGKIKKTYSENPEIQAAEIRQITDNNETADRTGLRFLEKLKTSAGPSELISRYRNLDEIRAFQNGIPSFSEFPFKTWQKLINRASQCFNSMHLGYGDAAGYKPLREAVANYLRKFRAVNCTAEQIIIINGTQQGLDLISRVLLKPGNTVWLEDPGYFGARGAMIFADAVIFPCPIDKEGLDIEYAAKNNPAPRLIFTTPSHQFPLGYVMSISRRLKLLQYAGRHGSWIIEDDYDSEFRYSGSPLPSLQGLDQYKRVLYLGTFSKVLFPGLRIGYIVLPDKEMGDLFATVKSLTDRQNPIFEQVLLAKFIEEGHFAVHLRKMRMLYKKRQEFLVAEVKKELKGFVKIEASPAGMHIILQLPKKSNDKKISEEALKRGIIVRPLSEYSIKFFPNPGLLLGYTAFEENQIREGIRELKLILTKSL